MLSSLKKNRLKITALLALATGGMLCQIPSAVAEGSLEDYKRAENRMSKNLKLHNIWVNPKWIESGKSFWYRKTGKNTIEFIHVNPSKNKKRPLFNHTKMARALHKATGHEMNADALPLRSLKILKGQNQFQVRFGKTHFNCDLKHVKCTPVKEIKANIKKGEVTSPDGRWAAYVQNSNLYVRNIQTGKSRALTQDGITHYAYATSTESQLDVISAKYGRPGWTGSYKSARVLWSPDSTKLLTYRVDERRVQEIPFVDSLPDGQLGARPKLHTARYVFPNDVEVATSKLMVFNVENGARTDILSEPIFTFHDLILTERLSWGKNGKNIYFYHARRGFRHINMYVADAKTGQVRELIDEKSPTWIQFPFKIPTELVTADEKQVFWISERTGWKHIYRYNTKNGKLINAVTQGEWRIEKIKHIDSKGQWIYFTARGGEAGRDPYYEHFYRAHFDGSELTLLTPENAQHDIDFSPNGRYFLDRSSTVGTAPITILRRVNGQKLRTLEKADISSLIATGWQRPERFHVKARDGKTDLYGVIYRPSNYDPKKKYPILDWIYGGQQALQAHRSFNVGSEITELGFIIIRMDGTGTPGRSQSFQNTLAYGRSAEALKNMEDDHILAIKQLAAKDPSIDLDRVGIFGHSGGGYATVRALNSYPDFYKVGVASAGSHDQRLFHLVWGESFVGHPNWENPDNIHESNSFDVSRMEGKLLLMHGEMDDNVHPANSMQVVGSLIKANKDFDLIIFPGDNHGSLWRNPYFIRKRWDYLVEHLMGVTPPAQYQIGKEK